jgi:hypothetical protein
MGLELEPRAALGTGWDAVSEEALEQCVSSPNTIAIPAESAYVGQVTATDAIRFLGFDDQSERSRSRLDLSGDGARAAVGRALIDASLATQSIEFFEARFDVVALDDLGLEWLVDPAVADFSARCGDRAILRTQPGGQFVVAWRIDHASGASRAELLERLGSDLFRWSDADIQLRERLAAWRGRAALRVLAIQRGGDPAAISAALGEGTVASAWKLDCPMDALEPCAAFLKRARGAATAQGTGTFSGTLEAAPVDLEVAAHDWSSLGFGRSPRPVPLPVSLARNRLLGELDTQLSLLARLELLASGRLLVAEEIAASIPSWRAAVDANLGIVAEAAKVCWDDLADPADPVQVARCASGAEHASLVARGFDDQVTPALLEATIPSLD